MHRIFNNKKRVDQEYEMSNFIPYKCHWDSNTILTKDNQLIQVIRVSGFSFEAANGIELEIKKQLRNVLFKSISSGNLCMYFHTIRRKVKLQDEEDLNTDIDFLKYMQEKLRDKNKNEEYFVNDLYISVVYKIERQGVAFFGYLYRAIMQKKSQDYWINDINKLKEELHDLSSRIFNALQEYSPQLLGVNHKKRTCSIMEFLYLILNCGIESNILVPSNLEICQALSQNRITFKQKHLELSHHKTKKYAGTVSIKDYPPYTSTIILDGLLKANYEFILTQSFSFINKNVAVAKIQLQQNRMIQTQDKSVSQIVDISAALDLAMGGDIAFGMHHLSIMCIGDDKNSVEQSTALAINELSNYAINAVRDDVNMEPVFWGQLPGNISYIVRKSIIHTINLAGLASLHNYSKGKKYNNHWGEYVAMLSTTSNTSYYFNFHVRDVGHTIIVGPTGAGKTVLMNFLCAKLQKFNPRMFFFDKDRGAEIFIRSLNGAYNTIDSSEEYSMNPLQLEDTKANRDFLFEWLKILVTPNGEKLTPSDNKTLFQAIEGNYKLNTKDRRISNIAPFLGVNKENNIASRLEIWYGNGAKAGIFDNERDHLDLSSGNIFGFEMSNILQDKLALAPALSYIFHKIQTSLTGYPTAIVLDEAWALIDNEIFAPKLKDWLKVLRKLNTFVIFATQSVEDATKSMISDTLVQQTATQIFLPNLKATSEYKKTFMLSEREFEIVKNTDPATRYFLIKQGIDSVIAKINLSNTGQVVNILSGNAETVNILHNLIQKHGQNPKAWFYKFKEIIASNLGSGSNK